MAQRRHFEKRGTSICVPYCATKQPKWWSKLSGLMQQQPILHWIEKLTEELGAPEPILDDCAVLVADYSASRYPAGGPTGPFGEFTESDADDRLTRALAVIQWAESQWANADG